MNIARYSLAFKNGFLCIRFDTTDYTEPKVVSLWWPIGETTMSHLERIEEPLGVLLRACGTFTFEVIGDKRFWLGPNKTAYRLKDEGKTLPIHREEYGAKRPARLRNVSWKNGAWQVATKAERYELAPELPPLEIAPWAKQEATS